MASAISVSDSLSNAEEQIERAAKIVGTGNRRKVFEAIYHHKSRAKTVGQIVKKTGLKRIPVLQQGRHLAGKQIVKQTRKDGDTAYEMIDFFQLHKREILALAGNRRKIAAYPTKRKVIVNLPKVIKVSTEKSKIKRVTIDEIDSFAKVRKIPAGASLSPKVTEEQFKNGVQSIIGEAGKFKDWGGETSDLRSGRVSMKGKRYEARFAFKGPGLKAKLVPGKMGKNGDQGLRLFSQDADIFFVQHWREIDASVIDLMMNLAVVRSVTTGNRIYYGIIDGQDSERLRAAYPQKFIARKKKNS